jgi:hypothetical protein
MVRFRHRDVPRAAWAYAVVVATLWAVAEATHLDNGWTVAAYIASLPFGPFVEVFLLIVFSLLGFDPTTSAPAWQNVTSVIVVVFAMGACGFMNVFATVATIRTARERRARHRGTR